MVTTSVDRPDVRYGGRDWDWAELARLHGLRLPAWDEPATAEGIWQWVQRLGIPEQQFLDWVGYEDPASLVSRNPLRPLRCYVGEMLEYFDYEPIAEDQVDVWRARELALDGEEKLAPPVRGLYTGFADAGNWEELARWAGVELPPWDEDITEQRMSELLHALKVSVRSYQQWSGDIELMMFKWRNMQWGLRPWYGLVLEVVADGKLSWRTPKK